MPFEAIHRCRVVAFVDRIYRYAIVVRFSNELKQRASRWLHERESVRDIYRSNHRGLVVDVTIVELMSTMKDNIDEVDHFDEERMFHIREPSSTRNDRALSLNLNVFEIDSREENKNKERLGLRLKMH